MAVIDTTKIAANKKLRAYYVGRRKKAMKWKADNEKRAKKWAGWIKHFDAKIAAADRRIAALEHPPAGPSVMYDAVTVSNIPKNAPAVAGYVNGHFQTFPTLLKEFPHAKHLSIAVSSGADAMCLDVEAGDATNAVVEGWLRRQHARGLKRPVIYTSVSNVRTLAGMLSAAGFHHGTHYKLWSAHFTFRAHLCDAKCGFGMPFTADATQWTDKALGRSLDQSLCSPDFWT